MSFSDYLEGELLDHIFGIDAGFAQPSTHVGLSTADPGDNAAGLAEPAGGAYARVAFSTWTRSGNQVQNNAAVTFPEATASWGTITHFGIFDAASAGNLLASGALSVSKAIASGDTASFATGQLTVTLD